MERIHGLRVGSYRGARFIARRAAAICRRRFGWKIAPGGRGNRVRHYLNGVKVVDVELGGDEWNEKVAGSKFAVWPKFGKNATGHIVLQDHRDEVWYRNMRIEKLEEKDSEEAAK